MSEIDYGTVLSDLERRRAELDAAISAIRLIIGASGDSVSVPTAIKPAASLARAPTSHAFFGMGIGEAAKKYLEMAKEPKKAVEIAKALKAGGLINTSPNFAATVATTLRRERDAGTVVQLPDTKAWGLAGWFGSKARTASSAKGNGVALEESNESSEPEHSDDGLLH